MYVHYQPNNKRKHSSDCVIRAFTYVTNQCWLDVYDQLVVIGRELQDIINSKTVYRAYLKKHGFKYVGISNKKGSTRPTVRTFSEATEKCKDRVYVAVLANHLVACANGNYYDTFDCGYKSLYGYWYKYK